MITIDVAGDSWRIVLNSDNASIPFALRSPMSSMITSGRVVQKMSIVCATVPVSATT